MIQQSEHIGRVVSRAKAFYEKTDPGHFLVNAHIPADTVGIPPLHGFDLDHQLTEWLDHKLAAARSGWAVKEGLDDDGIPSICPQFGIAEHSAWLGAEVLLQEATCLPVPPIKSPDDLSVLRLSEQDKWFGYMKSGYEYLRSRCDGSFVLSVRGTMAPMDVANALRGDELFVDFLTDEEFCHRLMSWLVDAIRWYYGHLLSWADGIEGGHVFKYGGGWMPDATIGHLSNDAAMLCSPEIYEQFGFPYESRLTGYYDRALYHVHNEKLHYVPRLADLRNLAMLEVTHDPKTPPIFEDLERILGATKGVNLMLGGTSDQVRAHISELLDRNVFLQVSCKDRSDADDIVAFVRSKSKAL